MSEPTEKNRYRMFRTIAVGFGDINIEAKLCLKFDAHWMRKDVYEELKCSDQVQMEGSKAKVKVPTLIDGITYDLTYIVVESADFKITIGKPILDVARVILYSDGPVIVPLREYDTEGEERNSESKEAQMLLELQTIAAEQAEALEALQKQIDQQQQQQQQIGALGPAAV